MSLAIQLAGLVSGQVPDVPVSGYALDHRRVKPGMVFAALQGTRRHGLYFADAAVAAGAVAVLYEPEGAGILPTLDVPLLPVPDLGHKLGLLAARFYGHASESLRVVGVTGTDGKTSVTHFIAEALAACGQSSAVIGTLGSGIPGALGSATHTTPDAIEVQALLATFRAQGYQSVSMEVSSHALVQGRIEGVQFDTAVLTNLTRDHLDYHGSEAAYAQAKRRLFFRPGLKQVVLNRDDAFGRSLMQQLKGSTVQVLSYGVGMESGEAGGIYARAARFDPDGIHAVVVTPWGEGQLYAPVLGRFNLHNLLAALSVLLLSGIGLEQALTALAQVETVPGRMQRVQGGRTGEPLVVVDYAHTPGALRSVLEAARVHTPGRLICVFGCGGDRDAGKRPLMAQAAEQGAERVIVTDDNPRTEPAEQIFVAVRQGFAHPDRVHFEHDRAGAIRQAIQEARSEDTVLIAGKGHETLQQLQGRSIPFDDREQAWLALQEWHA